MILNGCASDLVAHPRQPFGIILGLAGAAGTHGGRTRSVVQRSGTRQIVGCSAAWDAV